MVELKQYRLYFLSSDNKIVEAHDFASEGGDEAVQMAIQQSSLSRKKVELWLGTRRIGRYGLRGYARAEAKDTEK